MGVKSHTLLKRTYKPLQQLRAWGNNVAPQYSTSGYANHLSGPDIVTNTTLYVSIACLLAQEMQRVPIHT